MRDDFRLYRLQLKKHGYFSTRTRFELFRAFRGYEALPIANIVSRVHRDPSSVYRNLKLFEELGIIKRVKFGHQVRFELGEKFRHHHHHLFCTNCGKTMELPESAIMEDSIKELSQTQNFHASHHQLEILGVCDYCYTNKIVSKVGIKY